MKQWTVDNIVQATGGTVVRQNAALFDGFGTDSRANLQGKVFIALKGEVHDAHKFVDQAVKSGAAGVIVSEWGNDPAHAELAKQTTVFKVDDTLNSLQALGLFYRRQFKGKVVGITGSNGKTTTKEFCRAVLSAKFKVSASKGSFNNHWGVPLSILESNTDDQVWVLEMGMNHAGELTQLAKISEPDITVVTTVGRAHLEGMGSLEATAKAKEELYLAAPKSVKIFNLDNGFTEPMFRRAIEYSQSKHFTFSSFRTQADVSLKINRMDLDSVEVTGHIGKTQGSAKIPIFGRQNTSNFMAVSCIALACGMSPDEIWKALPRCQTHWGRNQIIPHANGARILFDAYNANPDSTAQLIKNMLELNCKGKKIGVFGEMLELGSFAKQLHSEIGEMAGNTDFDVIWFMGPHWADFKAGLEKSSFSKTSFFSDTYEQNVAMKVASMIDPSDIAVIKGSRGMKMERVVQAWNPSLSFQKKD